MNKGIGIQGNVFPLVFVLSHTYISYKSDFLPDNPAVQFWKMDCLFTGISVLIVQPVTVATLKNKKFKKFGTEEEIQHL